MLWQRDDKAPFRVSSMLATQADAPFARSNWVLEEKYGGLGTLVYKEDSCASRISRNTTDRTARFPEIVTALEKPKTNALCIDGEVIVFDARTVSRFQPLQQRKGRSQCAIFDCLYAAGSDLREKTLSLRCLALERRLDPSARLVLSPRLAGGGLEVFQIASKRTLDGAACK